MSDKKNLIQDVIASPLGMIIASVGQGVAQAQNALDEGSIAAVLDIYAEGDDQKMALLREIGYRPTFYTLPETTGEIKVALKLGQTSGVKSTPSFAAQKSVTPSASVRLARHGLNTGSVAKMYATPVDAGYANRYGFSSNISAQVTFKILPVPAPEGADELRMVPNLVGKTVEQAEEVLSQFGLEVQYEELDSEAIVNDPAKDRLVESQTPTTDQQKIIRMGETIVIKLKKE